MKFILILQLLCANAGGVGTSSDELCDKITFDRMWVRVDSIQSIEDGRTYKAKGVRYKNTCDLEIASHIYTVNESCEDFSAKYNSLAEKK